MARQARVGHRPENAPHARGERERERERASNMGNVAFSPKVAFPTFRRARRGLLRGLIPQASKQASNMGGHTGEQDRSRPRKPPL